MSTTTDAFTLTRVLDAPREVVFQAWTDPAHLDWYFSGNGEPSVPITVEPRVGGAWRVEMIVNAETVYITGGIYTKFVPPERLAFIWGAPDGWPVIGDGHPEDEMLATVTFEDLGERTRMHFHCELHRRIDDEMRGMMKAGWTMTLDRLINRYNRPAAT